MDIIFRKKKSGSMADTSGFGYEMAGQVREYHRTLQQYKPTPLVNLKLTAEKFGIKDFYIKDESKRFGLNAFKGLGGSYAMGKILSKNAGQHTFVTATDGNHGRGVAWAARQLGQKAVVYMPKGSSKERLLNIQAEGARASITELNYDDTVRLARQMAEQEGWILIQDTSWEGYTEIPADIMRGYTTMALEALEQLNGVKPTHIFIQAGVGSLAGAIQGFFSDVYGENAPIVVVVESEKASCLFDTAKADDGKIHIVTGNMDTIMAGLACGEPCTEGWKILKEQADAFVKVEDWVAAEGMRILGNPAGEDKAVISGESGAAGFGTAVEILRNKNFASWKEKLGLGENSIVLCFSTEGDTDRENYRKIVWDGSWPRPED